MFYFIIIPENQCTLLTVIQNTHTHTFFGVQNWNTISVQVIPISYSHLLSIYGGVFICSLLGISRFLHPNLGSLVLFSYFPHVVPPLPLPFVSYYSLHSIQTKVLTNSKICKHKEPLSETSSSPFADSSSNYTQEIQSVCHVAYPWVVGHQLLCPWNFPSRQEYWSGMPFPTPRDLLEPRIKPVPYPPALTGEFFTTEPPGKSLTTLSPTLTSFFAHLPSRFNPNHIRPIPGTFLHTCHLFPPPEPPDS